MGTIEVRCKVELSEGIVLTTLEDTSFPAIRLQLASGDSAWVEMDVPEKEIKAVSQGSCPKGDWYVNARVHSLKILLRLENVSADELDRLYGRHSSAKSFVVHCWSSPQKSVRETHQEAAELGQRVANRIREAANMILRFIRDNYGQHWLRILSDDDEPVQNFLDRVHAEWREEGNPWKRLFVGPTEIRVTVYMGVVKLYLETADWQAIQVAITRKESPPELFALLSDSRERYHQGDRQVAIIHLNSALEWAVQRFLRAQLGPKIPQKSLETVLKQSHKRLLDNWVLPLDRELGLSLENTEWQSITKIQELRRQAGHPTLSTGVNSLTEPEFTKLAKDAASAIAKLTGLVPPKLPPPMAGVSAGGTA